MRPCISMETLPTRIQQEIRKAVRAQLGDSVTRVHVENVELSGEQLTVVIRIYIDDEKSASSPSYFGLTRSIRGAMGAIGESVFPVIRPVSASA